MSDETRIPLFEEFSGAPLRGEFAVAYRPKDGATEIARICDPSASVETIHWGRNYIYAVDLNSEESAVPAVVKQFSNQGLRKRLDRKFRGSKAERSWRVAKELLRAGLATPDPLLWGESDEIEGPSFFVARRLVGAVEVRQFFRRLNHEAGESDFPVVDDAAFLKRLGQLARRINDAGILYRDLSLGNILAVAGDDGELELFLIDFNRARTGRTLGVYRRTRDICRLPVLQKKHREAFLDGYWGKVPPRWSFRWWFYGLSVDGYILKHAIKKPLRKFRLKRRHAHGGSHHPHIPAAHEGASTRDRAVWDHLSDQPHQHATKFEKYAIRFADSPSHIRDLVVSAGALPRTLRRYRSLKSSLYSQPSPFTGIGLALRPFPIDPAAHLDAIDDLGVRQLLIRLHPWDDDHSAELDLARALSERGRELAFVIPQNRDLVRDRSRWRAAVEELADLFSPLGCRFQVGQAINRSKWGVWTHGEYVDLYLEAADILRRRPGVEVLGPAVIDFEFQSILALVNGRYPGLHFDAVSSLLYVDRRGAPENRQMGLDTIDKVTLLRAIAETGRNSSERCWITEVNWPLWEGPHSPAGKTVSVNEEEHADYLVRYYLLALGTGLVERVFWWRLAARGYGLAAPGNDGTLRRRPAFAALRTLHSELDGALFHGPLPSKDGRFLYRFTLDGEEIVVAWSAVGPGHERLPRPALQSIGRDGQKLKTPVGFEIEVGPSPSYHHLGEA